MTYGSTMEPGNLKTEALPTAIAVPMAVLEQTGVRKAILDEWRALDGKVRNLSGDMAAKAICGMMFDNRDKCPLYQVRVRCSRFPNDRLFGAGIGPEQLSDTALGKRLDALAGIDMAEFVWRSHGILTSHYGIECTDDLSGDATNYTLFGSGYVDDDVGTMPMLGGNAKDHTKDLLQKNFYCLTDSNGILCYTRAYDGNVSDKRMNDDAIDFLARKSEESGRRFVLTADCKLCFDDLMSKLESSGLFYVTKVPANYDRLLRDRTIVRNAEHMAECPGRKGLWIREVPYDHGGTPCRLVLFRLDSTTRRVAATAERKVAKLQALEGRTFRNRFGSDDEARAYAAGLVPDVMSAIVRLEVSTFRDERCSRPGREVWRLRVDAVGVDREALDRRNRAASTSVLVTNLPGEGGGSVDALGIVRHYLDQYLSEKNFRMMKSGMKVDDVFLHRPGRQDATLLLVALSTQVSNVIDHVLRGLPGKRRLTCSGFCDRQVYAELVYRRETDTFVFNGSEQQHRQFLEVKELLGLQDRYLMGFRARRSRAHQRELSTIGRFASPLLKMGD